MRVRIGSLSTKLLLVLLVGAILALEGRVVRADPQDVIVSVSTDKNTYSWGETVTITVSVTNNGSSTLDFTFANSHQAGYSIFLRRGRKLELVWTTLNDFYFLWATNLTLQPGETKNIPFSGFK
jgi:uncharacterized protein (DUF58 family)